MAEDVVNELDAEDARQAEATAREGADVARAAGFYAEPLGRRALSKTVERNTSTVWRAILTIADEQEAVVIVVGARRTSGLGSALLGSVSHGLLHNSTRPVLVVPPGAETGRPGPGPSLGGYGLCGGGCAVCDVDEADASGACVW